MSIPSMRVHTDPPLRHEEYECTYPGCEHAEWAFVAPECPAHRRRMTLRGAR